MRRDVADGVGADLVRPVDVREQAIGDHRIAGRDLEPNAAPGLEHVGDWLERYLDRIDLAGRELGLRFVRVPRAYLAAALGVAPHMRGAQPALGNDHITRLNALGALIRALRELLRHLDAEIHVVARGRG